MHGCHTVGKGCGTSCVVYCEQKNFSGTTLEKTNRTNPNEDVPIQHQTVVYQHVPLTSLERTFCLELKHVSTISTKCHPMHRVRIHQFWHAISDIDFPHSSLRDPQIMLSIAAKNRTYHVTVVLASSSLPWFLTNLPRWTGERR